MRLLRLWVFSLVPSVAVGVLLLQLYRQSTAARVGHADAVIARACDMIQERFGFHAAGWSDPAPKRLDQRLRSDLTVRHHRPADLASFLRPLRRPAGPPG